MSMDLYINRLRQCPRDQVVQRGFGEIDSWRGDYSEAAMSLGRDSTTVGEMLDTAVSSLGTAMTGYKGGEYPISLYTTLNLDHPGEYSNGQYGLGILLDLLLDDTVAKQQVEIDQLKLEVAALRQFGNKDCTSMADDFLETVDE